MSDTVIVSVVTPDVEEPLLPDPTLAVTSVVLVNADTDADLAPISDGMTVSLTSLGTSHLNVRAETNPASVGSVDAIDSQTGTFEAVFEVTPQAAGINAAVVMAGGSGTNLAWTDLAAIVRFNTSGVIDARNGSTYEALASVAYVAGAVHTVRMTIDVPNHRYSAFVRIAGGAEQTLATSFAFRTEQQNVASLEQWGLRAEAGQLDG